MLASISFTNSSFLSYLPTPGRLTQRRATLELFTQFANVIPELVLLDIRLVEGHVCVGEIVLITGLAYVAVLGGVWPRDQNLALFLGDDL